MRLFAAILLKEMFILSPRPHEEKKRESGHSRSSTQRIAILYNNALSIERPRSSSLSLSSSLFLSLSLSLSLSLWFYLSLFLSSISALLAMCSYRSLSLKRWTIFPEARSRRRSSSCLSLPKRAYRVNPYLTHPRLFV